MQPGNSTAAIHVGPIGAKQLGIDVANMLPR